MPEDFRIYDGFNTHAIPDFSEDDRINAPQLYQPSPALASALNVSMHLGKPLLLTGEPGSGKTQLAHNVAWSFGLEKPLVFNTRTSSKATDLFYHYDALGHLQYAQNPQNKTLTPNEIEERFIKYQALGKAIMSGTRQVVLIDEIDKAPRDLPNDILNILEDLEFDVPEIGKSYSSQAAKRPVIILTSNSEKNLPDAFLRRCIYFHLNFPDEAQLLHIIAGKLGSGTYTEQEVRSALIPHFMHLRNVLKRKKPGTAELLTWISLLGKLGMNAEGIKNYMYMQGRDKDLLMTSYNVVAKTQEDLNTLRQMLESAAPPPNPA